ncbi:MAG: hypothetical protein ACKN9Z_00490, partial [Actinomycetota bacterium]
MKRLLNLINPSSLNNMSDHVNDTVKPPKKRQPNKRCGYKLPDGQGCNKSQQYNAGNSRRYCYKHFKEWSAAKATACNVIAESTSAVAESTLAVEPNTMTIVDESSAPNIVASERDVPVGSNSAVEPNTTTTADESSARNIVASERDVPAGSTSAVESSTTTTGDEYSAHIIAPSVPARSNSAVDGSQNEEVHPENDYEFNAGNDFFSAQDDGHDGNNLRSTTPYNQDNYTHQLDMDEELLATIEASDTVIFTNSPQSRAITSESATQLNPEILAFINIQIQNGIRQYNDEITKLKRSFNDLKKKYKTFLMRKKQRITGPDSLPTISTAS